MQLTSLAFLVIPLAASLGVDAAVAQSSADASRAEYLYDREMTRCNSGTMASPERDACVREAGLQLERSRGGLPGDVTRTTADGRATVVSPAGGLLPAAAAAVGTDVQTTGDGRANVAQPSDRSIPR